MQISNHFVVVEKLEEKKEGLQLVELQDSSTFKGKVKYLPEIPVYIGNKQICVGDAVLFSKYSPDTQDVELGEEKLKFIKIEDILAVL